MVNGSSPRIGISNGDESWFLIREKKLTFAYCRSKRNFALFHIPTFDNFRSIFFALFHVHCPAHQVCHPVHCCLIINIDDCWEKIILQIMIRTLSKAPSSFELNAVTAATWSETMHLNLEHFKGRFSFKQKQWEQTFALVFGTKVPKILLFTARPLATCKVS